MQFDLDRQEIEEILNRLENSKLNDHDRLVIRELLSFLHKLDGVKQP